MSSEPTNPSAAGDVYASAELYARIQQFYADQMGLMDHGHAEEWAATFTEDAVFQGAVSGRAALADSARAHTRKLAEEKADFRHWIGMLDVRPEPDGSLRTRAYALTARTVRGEALQLTASVVCRDHLVLRDGRWLVSHRSLRRDGTA
ncbi:nuclear transport factor 2 family protein [Streptomyces sp. NPDC057939]|uniref:nuclear transport factor 2 family protein n=1 Tax=Streptomyces sp. NPDC057939 TaxID=3346284 RepID=UPI0036EEE28D